MIGHNILVHIFSLRRFRMVVVHWSNITPCIIGNFSYASVKRVTVNDSYRCSPSCLPSIKVKVKVKVTLLLRVSQSVCFSVEPKIFLPVWKFLSYLYGAPSLTRGRVCNLSVTVCSNMSLSVCTTIYILPVINNFYIQYIQGLCQSGVRSA
jgi:hypothetical protein